MSRRACNVPARLVGFVCAVALACGETAAPSTPVAQVRITPDSPTVGVRATLALSVVLTDASGHVLTGRPVTWNSLAPATATVDSNGIATGIAKGTTTITATVEGKSAQVSATVRYIFAQVAAGTDYTCAVTTGRQAFCWGANSIGQLGTGLPGDTSAPVIVSGDPSIAELAANRSSGSARHTCARRPPSAAYCWGDNTLGQLGNASFTPSPTPVLVSGPSNVAHVFAGNVHSCALTPAGAASCWGWNADGQLGSGDTTTRDVPIAVATSIPFFSLAPGTYHTCGIAIDQHAYCWGGNPDREYGFDTTGASLVPRLVSTTLQFVGLAAGVYHTCGIEQNGAGFCWGGNHEGQVGTGDTVSPTLPQPVVGGRAYVEIVAGSYHTCAIATSGVTYCWGYNATSQLGVSSSTVSLSLVPIPISGSMSFVRLSAGGGHTCGLTATGDIFCWGANSQGQLGNGTTSGGPDPVKVLSP